MKKIYSKKLVSIIMNCHNGSKFLSESIKSVLDQSYDNWELIFFDNISTDKSLFIAKSFNDQRIKIHISKKLLNLYEARNKALQEIKGHYVCFLDTDDVWEKNKLEKQVNFLDDNPNYSMVYSNYYILNFKKQKNLRFESVLPHGKITKDLLKLYTIGILTTCIKSKIFKEFNFEDHYNIIGDFDFFIKLSKFYEIGCIQEPLAAYRVHSNNYSKKNLKIYINELKEWLKKNSSIQKEMNLSLFYLRYYLFKLKIKYLFSRFNI